MRHHFAPNGWVAVFSGTEEIVGRFRPVEAWREGDGVALVVDSEIGKLRPVSEWEDFSHLERAQTVYGVIPGAGWRVKFFEEGDVEPVVCWLVSAIGNHLTPVIVDSSGEVMIAHYADQFIPPGCD